LTAATTTQVALQYVGYTALALGLASIVWGITIDGKQWWKRFIPGLTQKTPMVEVADVQALTNATALPNPVAIAPHPLSVSPPEEAALIKGNKEAQHAETFQSAFDDFHSNRVPFTRIRHDAPQLGLILDDGSSAAANIAYDIEGAMRQAAVDGGLKVWGRKYRGPVSDNDPLVEIPASHFEDYGFMHGCLHYAMPNEKTATGTIQMLARGEKGKEGVTYYDLFISYDDARRVLTQFAKDKQA
jgi:hypothetical protein